MRAHSLGSVAGLLAVATALLLGAWLFSTFPYQAPDEASHYLRALSITNGQLLGPKVPYTQPAAITMQLRRWMSGNTRAVEVPPNLSPSVMFCANDHHPDTRPPGCVEQSYTGNYPPLPYLLPAAALAVSNDATGALWLGRVASALPCLLLIALAFMFAARGGLWPLFGVAVALTPMTLFLGSVISPHGLQIAASLAFAAGLLRIAREPGTVSTVEAGAIAVIGAIVVLAWQLGPVFAVCDLALAAALLDRRRVDELRGRRFVVGGIAAALGVALPLYVIWALVSGSSHGGLMMRFGHNLTAAWGQLSLALHQSIGSFGANTVPLPRLLFVAWLVVALAGGVAALVVSPWRLRLVAVAAPVLVLLVGFLLYAFLLINTGTTLQGRLALPLIALPPLVWGELLGRARHGVAVGWRGVLVRRLWPFGAAGIAATAVLQCWAWWTNARFNANPSHAFWFLSNPAWSPPLGWPLWTVAALLGGLLLIVVAGLATRREAGSGAAVA